jgi:hypothetical protein
MYLDGKSFQEEFEQMISREKLLRTLKHDLGVCQKANPTDLKGKERRILEYNTLLSHLMWAERVGDDEAELERIVLSLETNNFIRGYEHWRESATK